MCLKPIQILNPHYNSVGFRSEFGELVTVPTHLLSHRRYIEVPCGHCADCRNTYYNSLLQRCIVEASTSYMYFVTLTYDNQHIPYVDINNDRIFYLDYSHIQLMFKRFRKRNILDREYRYICVNEYGDKKHRPHAHILIFVSRKEDDTPVTPFNIEKLLFDNLGNLFAKNVGTRKYPKYEKLFTYQIRYTPKGVKTNYFVKYVDTSIGNVIPSQSETTIKTVRYLISYLNKPSRFDDLISEKILDFKRFDPILYRKLGFLRSRVRFSKGLGFGFKDGKKLSMSPISQSLSYTVGYYNELHQSLPSTVEQFKYEYPTMFDNMIHFMYHNTMRNFDNLQDYIIHLQDINELQYYLLGFKYMTQTMSNLVREHFFQRVTPCISYFFNQLTVYRIPKITTYLPNPLNPTYRLIRSYVHQGLDSKCPFIPFIIGDRYIPLCNFYKRYCTSMLDVENLYKSLGLSCYDEWKDLFDNSLTNSLRRSNISKSNTIKHELSENTICISQNIVVPLCRPKEETNIYSIVFHK